MLTLLRLLNNAKGEGSTEETSQGEGNSDRGNVSHGDSTNSAGGTTASSEVLDGNERTWLNDTVTSEGSNVDDLSFADIELDLETTKDVSVTDPQDGDSDPSDPEDEVSVDKKDLDMSFGSLLGTFMHHYDLSSDESHNSSRLSLKGPDISWNSPSHPEQEEEQGATCDLNQARDDSLLGLEIDHVILAGSEVTEMGDFSGPVQCSTPLHMDKESGFINSTVFNLQLPSSTPRVDYPHSDTSSGVPSSLPASDCGSLSGERSDDEHHIGSPFAGSEELRLSLRELSEGYQSQPELSHSPSLSGSESDDDTPRVKLVQVSSATNTELSMKNFHTDCLFKPIVVDTAANTEVSFTEDDFMEEQVLAGNLDICSVLKRQIIHLAKRQEGVEDKVERNVGKVVPLTTGHTEESVGVEEKPQKSKSLNNSIRKQEETMEHTKTGGDEVRGEDLEALRDVTEDQSLSVLVEDAEQEVLENQETSPSCLTKLFVKSSQVGDFDTLEHNENTYMVEPGAVNNITEVNQKAESLLHTLKNADTQTNEIQLVPSVASCGEQNACCGIGVPTEELEPRTMSSDVKTDIHPDTVMVDFGMQVDTCDSMVTNNKMQVGKEGTSCEVVMDVLADNMVTDSGVQTDRLDTVVTEVQTENTMLHTVMIDSEVQTCRERTLTDTETQTHSLPETVQRSIVAIDSEVQTYLERMLTDTEVQTDSKTVLRSTEMQTELEPTTEVLSCVTQTEQIQVTSTGVQMDEMSKQMTDVEVQTLGMPDTADSGNQTMKSIHFLTVVTGQCIEVVPEVSVCDGSTQTEEGFQMEYTKAMTHKPEGEWAGTSVDGLLDKLEPTDDVLMKQVTAEEANLTDTEKLTLDLKSEQKCGDSTKVGDKISVNDQSVREKELTYSSFSIRPNIEVYKVVPTSARQIRLTSESANLQAKSMLFEQYSPHDQALLWSLKSTDSLPLHSMSAENLALDDLDFYNIAASSSFVDSAYASLSSGFLTKDVVSNTFHFDARGPGEQLPRESFEDGRTCVGDWASFAPVKDIQVRCCTQCGQPLPWQQGLVSENIT